MRTINDYLKQLGLSEIETKLYLGLLETGNTTVMDLSNRLGIKRITAHFNIESLIKKGLVTETRKGARRQIVAEAPERLEQFLEEKEEEIQHLKKNLPSVIESIEKIIPRAQTADDVQVRYYEGKKAVKQVYEETMKAIEYYSFADLEKYYDVFPGTQQMWKDALSNPKRKVWDLLVDSPIARKVINEQVKGYHAKLLPSTNFFSGVDFADFIIYDEKVAMIQLEQNTPSATIIESKHMSLSLKAVHQLLWDLLPDSK